MTDEDDQLLFVPEVDDPGETPEIDPWPVLVVDDEPAVHDTTRLALADYRFDGRPLLLVNAYSGAEAIKKLAERSDYAVVLLDVVMETDHAGLDVARHIRDVLKNENMRIVMRTGQPGASTMNDVVTNYGVDDYREKTALRADQLKGVITTALASYKRLNSLQDNNDNLQQFTRIASHDLKAPLRQITGFAELLEKELDSENPDSARIGEAMSFIMAGTRNMAVLLDDLITMAATGTNESKNNEFDLNDALKAALENISQAISTSGAVISYKDLPRMRGSQRYMTQLFQNLIGNAIKFNNSVAPIIKIFFEQGPVESVLIISDNGIGFSEQQATLLFEPFYRGEPTLHVEGHGLGLAICKKIAEFHDGRIWAESEPTGGARFCLSLSNARILPEK